MDTRDKKRLAGQRTRLPGRRDGIRALESRDVLSASRGHLCRAVITRWIGLPLVEGGRFGTRTGSMGMCGFEHELRQLHTLGLPG